LAVAPVPEPVTVRVPGKVNLHLSVGPRRSDGYHDVTTVFQAVSLYDDVTAAPGDDVTCTTSGEGANEVPGGPANIAVAAALRLAHETAYESGARLRIVKNIPVAGGMAGGSADAAGALVACDALWQTGMTREELATVARRLGSDVPFALYGGSALGVGRGDQVTPVLVRGTFFWVLALAERGMSTASVYEEHDRGDPQPVREADGVLAALRASDAVALGRALAQRPASGRAAAAAVAAAHPRRGPRTRRARRCRQRLGPTVAFLSKSRGDAVALAAGLAGAGVCRGCARRTGR